MVPCHRRCIFSLVLAVGLTAGVANATHSNGEGPDKDLLSGSGKLPVATPFGTFPGQLHVTGMSEPDGSDPRGFFFVRIFGTPVGDVEMDGQVVCLTAMGSDAVFRGLIIHSNSPLAPPGFGIFGRVVDNGEPGADATPDSASGFLTPPPGPMPTCPWTPVATAPIDLGNFIVHDAP